LERDVLAHLVAKCQGKTNRVERQQLVWLMRTSGHLKDLSNDLADRKVRQAIENLRRRSELGALICASSSEAGYWIASSAAELEDVLAEEEQRGKSILDRVSRQRKQGLQALRALPLAQGRLL
jgi:hypothetical protein